MPTWPFVATRSGRCVCTGVPVTLMTTRESPNDPIKCARCGRLDAYRDAHNIPKLSDPESRTPPE